MIMHLPASGPVLTAILTEGHSGVVLEHRGLLLHLYHMHLRPLRYGTCTSCTALVGEAVRHDQREAIPRYLENTPNYFSWFIPTLFSAMLSRHFNRRELKVGQREDPRVNELSVGAYATALNGAQKFSTKPEGKDVSSPPPEFPGAVAAPLTPSPNNPTTQRVRVRGIGGLPLPSCSTTFQPRTGRTYHARLTTTHRQT